MGGCVLAYGKIRAAFGALCLLGAVVVSGVVDAKAVSKDGFAFPSSGDVKIVVFRPDVSVGSLRVGGLDEPNADWTTAARTNIQTAMEASAESREAQMTFLGDFEGAEGDLVNEYRGLFEAVAMSAFSHATLGDNLPTKLVRQADPKAPKRYRLDWSLGPEAQRLRAVTGGDYALFFFTKDSYGDAGRKVAQLLMAGLFGAYVPAGVHIGYAGLVDLRTGDLVWFNTDLAMGGDPREPDGATKRVSQLLAGFPKRGSGPMRSEIVGAVPAEPVATAAPAVAVDGAASDAPAVVSDPAAEAETTGDAAPTPAPAEPVAAPEAGGPVAAVSR